MYTRRDLVPTNSLPLVGFRLVRVLLSRFDVDGRGQIDQKDLVKVIQEIGEGQSYDQIRATIKGVDINATGKVEVDEFLEVRPFIPAIFISHALFVFQEKKKEKTGME